MAENEVVIPAADYDGTEDGMPKRPPIGSQLAAEWTEIDTNYSEKSIAFKFIITEEGAWKDKEDKMFSSKLPTKKEDGTFFWPAKNFAKATGIGEDRKGGKVTLPLGKMVGKPFTIVYGKEVGEYGEFSKPKRALPPKVITEG